MEYIYAKRKNDCTAGTFESSAFILSLKDEEEFSTLHSYGYHRVPIIGVYGEDYHLCLPLVLLSFPAAPRALKCALPRSVQEALGIVPKRQNILADFVKSYVDCIIHQSVVFLTGDESSSNTDVLLKGKDLEMHCYVKAVLTRAVKEVVYEDNNNDHFDQTIDLYFIIHTQPIPGLCQKFVCDNMDEINLVFHCWLFQEAPYDLEETFIDQLDMGIFEPHGVKPVHLDLVDSGIEFGATSARTVCIHGGRFSPENAQLQLLHDCDIHSFYSVAKCPGRSVVTYHVLPAHESAERAIRDGLSYTIGSLLHNLKEEFPEVAIVLDKFLNTLVYTDDAFNISM